MIEHKPPTHRKLINTARQMLQAKLAEGINNQTNNEMMVIGIALDALLKSKDCGGGEIYE